MLCGWEGNRRSGVALAMRHRLQWFIQLRAHGLRKGDEHPRGVWQNILPVDTDPPILTLPVKTPEFGGAKNDCFFANAAREHGPSSKQNTREDGHCFIPDPLTRVVCTGPYGQNYDAVTILPVKLSVRVAFSALMLLVVM